MADTGHVQPHVSIAGGAAPVSAAGAAWVTRGQGGGRHTHARPVAGQIRPEGDSCQCDDDDNDACIYLIHWYSVSPGQGWDSSHPMTVL